MDTTAPILASTDACWCIVFKRNGAYVLFLLRLNTHTTASVIMESILRKYHEEQFLWYRLLCRPVVEIATLARTNEVSDRPRDGQEVIIASHSRDQALTSALRRPSTLTSRAVDFIADHHMLAVDGISVAPKAIFLRRELSQSGIVLIATLVFLIVAGPGTVLGVLTKQAELGIALSAAIAAVFALVALFQRKGEESMV